MGWNIKREYLATNSGFFKEIISDGGTNNFSIGFINKQRNIFSETTGVIISDSLGITKSFKNWITSQNLCE